MRMLTIPMRELLVFLALLVVTACGSVATAQGVRGFGTPQGKLPVRGFGNPKAEEALNLQFPDYAAAVIEEDRRQAGWQIAKTDGNGDGIVTEKEWANSGYQTPRHFFYHDLNGDGILTHYEHTLGYAGWRRRKERGRDSWEERDRDTRRMRITPESDAALAAVAGEEPRVYERRKETWDLADYLIRVHDLNQNRTIERNEFQSQVSSFANLAGADSDQSGIIDKRELAAWLKEQLLPLTAAQLAVDLQPLDVNQDGQVSLREYAPSSLQTSMGEFTLRDRNGDGFITAAESNLRLPPGQHTYWSDQQLVLRSNSVVVSEIWIEEDVTIGDVDVRVKVAKENDDYLELHLITPDRRRVTLFSGGWQPWRGAYIFEDTLLDDDAVEIKSTLKQPPNPRALRPPGVGVDDQLSLTDLAGSSTRGMWRLIVRNQNDRNGIVQRWTLIVTPSDEGIEG